MGEEELAEMKVVGFRLLKLVKSPKARRLLAEAEAEAHAPAPAMMTADNSCSCFLSQVVAKNGPTRALVSCAVLNLEWDRTER